METPSPRFRTLHLVLIAIIVASLPCYCAGLIAIRRAPGEVTPTAAISPAPLDTATPASPSDTPIPGPTLTPSITQTLLVFTPSTVTPTATPSPANTLTPTYTDTPVPTLTPTPTDTPAPSD
ncbi:MAG: hypothetical protein NTU91_10845, partial [Chloroflexi bacterium]|nr:hypothetical protein [Chloroflexota bacterium]